MKLIAFLSSLLIAATAASQAHAAASPTLAPQELAPLQTDATVRVIDIRPPAAFAENHIPGAVSAPYAQWRGPADNPGKLPPLEKLTQLVRQLGLDASSHAVIVSTGENTTDFGAAARVYWTLKYLGLNNLSILNGGMQAWRDAGLPQDTAVAQVTPSQFTPSLNNQILATRDDVLAQIDNPKARLVDARPKAFFLGETKAPTASTPGTIRNAVNIEHSLWFQSGSTKIVSADEAKAIATREYPELVDDTISFCNTGHWASTDWFALSELAGVPNVRMYPESLAEWTNADSALPMDNTPGRGAQLVNSLKGLFN